MIVRGLAPRSAARATRIEGGPTAAVELPGEDGNITALVVANDLMTIGALRALRAACAFPTTSPSLLSTIPYGQSSSTLH
jgi:hypothetical protein